MQASGGRELEFPGDPVSVARIIGFFGVANTAPKDLEWKRELFARLSPYFDLGAGESNWSGVAWPVAAALDAGDYARARGYFLSNFQYIRQGLSGDLLYSIRWIRESNWFKTRTSLGRLTVLMDELVVGDSESVEAINRHMDSLKQAARGASEVENAEAALARYAAVLRSLTDERTISSSYAAMRLREAEDAFLWVSDPSRRGLLLEKLRRHAEGYGRTSVPAFEDLLAELDD